MSQIIVLGAVVMDLIYELPRWLDPKDFVRANSVHFSPGGKALNQVVAARRLGAEAFIVAAVGKDAVGDLVLNVLKREGVRSDFVMRLPDWPTGIVGILVNEGEPSFIGSDHASFHLQAHDVERALVYVPPGAVVSTSFEVGQDVLKGALELAKRKGAQTLLNPAPIDRAVPMPYLSKVDYFLPNLSEAQRLLDKPDAPPESLAADFLNMGAKAVCITLGAQGCYYRDKASHSAGLHVPAAVVEVVDTTGASDAFCGAFAVGLARGWGIERILTFANRVAGQACTKEGGMVAMPYSHEVEAG